ncbi:hypothetical protein LJC55_01900, partial [Eubacteriales bacterium OttesenSCG-928-N14]|nr:hypothetical protein [Eubacteriales bacterium OttesenSCG-928-N14]
MENKFNTRVNIMMLVCSALILVLVIALFNLTIVQGANLEDRSLGKRTRTVALVAERGSIYDKNGLLLAYDKASYDVVFHREPLNSGERWRALYTEIIIETIEIIEKNGNHTIDTFVIKKDEEGNLKFDWGGGELSVQQRRDEIWRGNMNILDTDTAEQAYAKLRMRYMLPDSLSFEDAVKVLSIWQEVQNYAFKSYMPVTIATDVDAATMSEISERGDELLGMAIEQSYTRVYPQGESAAHIVGYMGKQYDQDKLSELTSLGYSTEDLVGMYGIESTMEYHLSSRIGSRVGKKTIEVDNRGREIRVLEYVEPQRGDDVHLTIDIDMQKKLEEALADNIEQIRESQEEEYNRKIGTKNDYAKIEEQRGRKVKFAQTGAALVLDANNGDLLSLVSYPSFDPNQFVGGISEAEYQKLMNKDTTPLFNKAVSSRAEPGSTFKMVTCLAGLMEPDRKNPTQKAITYDERISCDYEFLDHVEQGHGPTCHLSSRARIGDHADQDMVMGLKNSCNYYFYTIANRLEDNALAKWAGNFGLSSRTGVQLTGEVTGYVANQQVLFDGTKDIDTGQKTYKPMLVRNAIKKQLEAFGAMLSKVYDDEALTAAANRIVSLVGEYPGNTQLGSYIRTIMREELNISETTSYAYGWHRTLNNMLYELIYTSNERVVSGIGQSVTQVTPVAMARYVAAIANRGTVYNVNIVDKVTTVSGKTVEEFEPQVFSTLEVEDKYYDTMLQGMFEALSPEDRGTGSYMIQGFKYPAKIAGKTGTAQVSTVDLENTSWFVCIAPYDVDDSDVKPEIVIVVYIPNGWKGSNAKPTAFSFAEYYLDRQQQQITE